ncbi:MAG: iron-sulfur cluster assembly accessory protein [Alphaproteobacteria bacterium]|nr:iron-sulfur cluster assembly accessory protein [Alphaproteobacteria bacterium]
MTQSFLTTTPVAKKMLQNMLVAREKDTLGIRIGVRTRGCTGRSYTMSFVDKVDPLDHQCAVSDALTLFIDPKAFMFIVGTTLDYQKTDTAEGFLFQNPNEKGRCGCGESFYT